MRIVSTGPAYKRWSELTIECYKRGCVCEGCELVPRLESGHCTAKEAVRTLILQGRRPPVLEKTIFLTDEPKEKARKKRKIKAGYAGLNGLSNREKEVLKLYFFSIEEIAEKLFISKNTVTTHIVAINRKLGTKTRIQAVLMALNEKYLTLDDFVLAG